VAGNVLTVTGLDAQDGSPVLDIKPYSSGFDVPGQTSQGCA
jgi:tRNA (Thr-GGU) A37 N-methylase